MAKATKIDDIKRPDKVAPNPTSRPVIVTNRPTLKNDPMMAADDTKSEDGSETVPMTHSAKIIVPINPDVSPDPDPTEPGDSSDDSESKDQEDNTQHSEDTAVTSQPTETPSSEPVAEIVSTPTAGQDTKVPSRSTDEIKSSSDAERDPEAEVTAEEAALAEEKARREQEIEDIITSGKYVVPIDAVQRRRSRIATTSLFILALVLAILLIDAVLDVGIVHVPSSIPHTHFFSGR